MSTAIPEVTPPLPKVSLVSKSRCLLIASSIGLALGATLPLLPFEDVLLFFACFIALILSLSLVHNSIRAFNYHRITISGVWYWTYVVMIFFPSLWLFSTKSDPYRILFLTSVTSIIVTAPLGFLLANKFFRFHPRDLNFFFSSSIAEPRSGNQHVFPIVLILMVMSIAGALLYFSQVETVPLIYLFHHPPKTPENIITLLELREKSFKHLDPRWSKDTGTSLFWLYMYLRNVLFPFLVMVTLGYALLTQKLKWWFSFLLMLIVGGFYVSAPLMRMPLAAMFMRIFFVFYIFRKGILGSKSSLFFFCLILGFPLVVTGLSYGINLSILDTLQRIGGRLFVTPVMDLYYYYEIFPEHHPYLYGQTIMKPFLHFLGLPHFYIENYVYHFINPRSFETGHSNAVFISNLHADFGIVGVLFGGLLTGFMLQVLQIYLSRQPKTILNISLYSFMIFAMFVLNFGSLTSVLISNGVILVILLVFAIKCLEKILSVSTTRPIIK